jgi:NitT/TauT family transport system substrate-binding protein
VRRGLIEAGKLESAAQLQGKRFAIKSASTTEYYTEKLLDRMGLTLNQIEVVDVPDDLLPEALSRGTVDIAYATEPLLTRILRSGNAAVLMPVQQIAPGFENTLFVMYGPNLLDKNPDAGRRFMVAYLKAVRQYDQGKTERNLEILVKHTGFDRELLQQACWPPFHLDGGVNMQSVLEYQDWGLKKGMVDSAVTEEQLWDPSYVEYANRVLRGD